MYRKGMSHPCIANIKRRMHVFPIDREFDELLAQRVRGVQFVHKIPITGVLDEETAQACGVADLMEPAWG